VYAAVQPVPVTQLRGLLPAHEDFNDAVRGRCRILSEWNVVLAQCAGRPVAGCDRRDGRNRARRPGWSGFPWFP
jgi:hypothetical protein